MKQLILDLFNDFECIGSKCPDTCCAGWSILVDPDSAAYYRNVKGSFGDRLRNGLVTNEEKTFMKLENKRCAFLNEKNLCDIYIELGSDKMCHTCKTYPRDSWQHGDILFTGLTLSCPEVARLLLEHKEPIQFHFSQTPDNPSGKENWELFNTLIRGLIISTDIMQNRAISFRNRLALLVIFNDALQDCLDAKQDCTSIFNTFSSPSALSSMVQRLETYPKNALVPMSFLLNFSKSSKDFNMIVYIIEYLNKVPAFLDTYVNPANSEQFDQLLSHLKTDTTDLQFEQYCVYYLSRHYMDSYTNVSPQKSIATLVYLYNLHFYFTAILWDANKKCPTASEQIRIFTSLSRCFEHSRNNLYVLYDLCERLDMTSTSSLLSLIL